jgi:hypothetical protein
MQPGLQVEVDACSTRRLVGLKRDDIKLKGVMTTRVASRVLEKVKSACMCGVLVRKQYTVRVAILGEVAFFAILILLRRETQ